MKLLLPKFIKYSKQEFHYSDIDEIYNILTPAQRDRFDKFVNKVGAQSIKQQMNFLVTLLDTPLLSKHK